MPPTQDEKDAALKERDRVVAELVLFQAEQIAKEIDPEYEDWKKKNGLDRSLSREEYVREFQIYS